MKIKMKEEVKTEDSLLSVSIPNTIHSLNQKRGETVGDFKIRLQKYFDDNGVNVKVV